MSITEQRLQLILAELQRDGRVSVNELSGRLGSAPKPCGATCGISKCAATPGGSMAGR